MFTSSTYLCEKSRQGPNEQSSTIHLVMGFSLNHNNSICARWFAASKQTYAINFTPEDYNLSLYRRMIYNCLKDVKSSCDHPFSQLGKEREGKVEKRKRDKRKVKKERQKR